MNRQSRSVPSRPAYPPDGPLRVEVVFPFGVIGGAEIALMRLLDACRERIEPTFVVLQHGPLVGVLEERGYESMVVPTGASLGAIGTAALRLALRWRAADVDIVLANGIKAAAVAVPGARMAGIRVAWFKHDFSHDRRLARPLGRAVDALIANSAEVARATHRDDAVIVRPPTGTPLGRTEARRRLIEAGMPDTAPVAAVVGRLVSYKGIDDVIRSLAREGSASWHLVVIGPDDPAEPHERARLEHEAASAGVAARVTFLGSILDAGAQLSAFDAVVVPTRVDARGFGHEGYGLTAREAIAGGVPVIVTGSVADPEVARAALVVAPGSPDEIARSLQRIEDPHTRDDLIKRGRELSDRLPQTETEAGLLVAALAQAATRPGAGLSCEDPVSVVITVRDEAGALDGLLEGLRPQLLPGDEVVIVDGGSRDDTATRVQAWSVRDSRIRLVESPGANIPRGRNVGVESARHDILLCTDAGCIPDGGWAGRLRSSFADALRPELVTGVYRPLAHTVFDNALDAACYPQIVETRRPGMLARFYGRSFGRQFDATMPTGRSMGFTRSAWESAGGFPEDLDTAEDVTFGRAIAARGGRCVLSSDAAVSWEQRATVAATARMFFRYGVGGGRSRDTIILGRDLMRVLAYPIVVLLLLRGGPLTRSAVAAAGAAYLSLPVARAVGRPRPAAVAALVPFALILKDTAKAAGCVAGLAGSFVRRSRS